MDEESLRSVPQRDLAKITRESAGIQSAASQESRDAPRGAKYCLSLF